MIVVTAGAEVVVEQPPPEFVQPGVNRGIGLLLVGVDGSTWDLANGPVTLPVDANTPDVARTGRAYALSGTVGLGDAEVEHQWTAGTILDGARHASMRHPARQVTLPVEISDSTSLGWRDMDAAWSDAIAPDGECYWYVTTPDASWRVLTMRRDSTDDSDGYEGDPLLDGYMAYPCKFVAADPYWRGPAIARTFYAQSQPDFFSPPGSSSVVNIGSSESTASATMRNPGHTPVWPRYTVTGPVTGFIAGVGAGTFRYGPVAAGATVVVDTAPTQQTVRSGAGADVWSGVLERTFAPIPRGTEVAINVELTGAGAGAQITVEISPGYRRAW